MVKGLLLIDGAKNTIIIDADAVSALFEMKKIDPKKVKRHRDITTLKSDVSAYLRGTYEEGKE